MKRVLILRLAASLAATAAIGGCTSWYAQPRWGVAYAVTAPPVERVEVVPTSPGFNYVWVGGHWGWANDNYRWVGGRWVVPASGFSTWVPGRWDRDRYGWFYRDGRWR
jgi:WXXGXW repeat (2 copies)